MTYDVITVGGGLAGASLARRLAEAGAKVLVLERTTTFRDRVRGEQMYPWGVAEARRLGLHDLLVPACAREVRYWCNHFHGAPPAEARDLVATTPHRAGALTFYHPDLQATLLQAAEDAGAEVRRGATVTGVTPGHPATVHARGGASGRRGASVRSVRAHLVVGADGRASTVRSAAGFALRRDPDRLVLAGASFLGMRSPEDGCHVFFRPERGLMSTVIPVGGGRTRVYVSHELASRRPRLAGRGSLAAFLALSLEAGTPDGWYEGARPAGPLAAFRGADRWVDHPYRDGVALVGDAAAASDPSFGCGLSLSLRDVRLLAEALLATADPRAAGRRYAAQHDDAFGAVHRLVEWMTRVYCETGPAADALRLRALPRIAADPRRSPDLIGLGPEAPSDEAARRRFFAEDDRAPA